MYELKDYCFAIDKTKPDFLKRCQDNQQIRPNVHDYADFSFMEKRHYDAEVQQHLDAYCDQYDHWKNVIQASLRYQKPNLVNANIIHTEDIHVGMKNNSGKQSPLYVYAAFMKCGKQYYAIEPRGAESHERKMYVHSCFTTFRTEEVPKYTRPTKKRVIVRKFMKAVSVFSKWRDDDH